MTLEEAKSYLRDKGLKSEHDYRIWWSENSEECKRIGMPKYPKNYYSPKKSKDRKPKS